MTINSLNKLGLKLMRNIINIVKKIYPLMVSPFSSISLVMNRVPCQFHLMIYDKKNLESSHFKLIRYYYIKVLII